MAAFNSAMQLFDSRQWSYGDIGFDNTYQSPHNMAAFYTTNQPMDRLQQSYYYTGLTNNYEPLQSMAVFDPTAQPFDPYPHLYNRLMRMAQFGSAVQTFVPHMRYGYDVNYAMTALYPDVPAVAPTAQSVTFNMASLRSEARSFIPHQPSAHSSISLDPEAPSFIPVHNSKLDATAPTFLLSRLATLNPQDDSLAERSAHGCNLVLPAAHQNNITDYLITLHYP
jgi:hypothetical protein